MPVLALFLFPVLAACAWACLTKIMSRDRAQKESDLASLAASLQQTLTSKRDIEKEILALSTVLSRTLKMYEAARDICATLDESKLLERFKDDLKKLINYEECRFVSAEEAQQPQASIQAEDLLLPLAVQDMHFGHLLVRGVSGEDRPYLGILARHFALGLKRSKLYRMTQELAITDSLTGLYTRRYAMERLEEELKRSRAQGTPLSFFMIDADDFKECNDRYGHLVGDMVLTEISRHIRDNVREIDMLARFGGEEFMVFAPRTNKESALSIAERIRRSIAETVVHAYDEHLKATVSIGLAAFPQDAEKLEDLIGKADWALYQAKKQGKNRVVVFGAFQESR
ncbi:MAG: GGDEF domain-containing protein [Candidatus Omnitrophica bacterium]|nr:GGDEF domain-containing protein [Candidatus Omnitrophota bacterium]MDD5573984.1 GGDEF domain-containing protein [Candidatus Omnitrophota bacterium]